MAFNIETFKSNIGQNGFLQSNKYDLGISFDNGLSNLLNLNIGSQGNSPKFTDITKDLSYRCSNAVLPGVALRTIDSNRYGLGIIEKMPYTGNYTDISLTFICDRFGLTYNFWYAWINYIFSVNGHDTTSQAPVALNRPYYTTEYKDNYAATFTIKVYDNSGNTALKYSLYRAFPISINDTSVSWGDNNNLLKLTTTISFREWAFEGTTLGGDITV